jgi:hypothetical protein
MALTYVTKAHASNAYKYEKRATVAVSPANNDSVDICGGPTLPIYASGVRVNSDIYWNTPSGVT